MSPDPALLVRARAATAMLMQDGITVDGETIACPPGDLLLAAVVWPETDVLERMGELVPE